MLECWHGFAKAVDIAGSQTLGSPVIGGIIATGSKVNDAWDFVQLGLPSDAWVGIGLAVFCTSTIAVLAGIWREQERSRPTRQQQEQTKFTIADFREIGGIFAGFLTRTAPLPQSPSSFTTASPSGAVIRAGGMTTEASSTSTSPAALCSLSGLNIRPTTSFIVIYQFRQSPARGMSIGLTLNSRPVWQPNPKVSPDDSAKGVVMWFVNGARKVKNTAVQMYVPTTAQMHKNIRNGIRPIATITDISLLAATNDHHAPVAIQNLEVFTLPSDD